MTNTFDFRKLINNTGFFCRITYDFSMIEGENGSSVTFAEDTKWNHTIEFAVAYFLDQFERTRGSIKLIIKVHEVETMIVDTTFLVVFYATVKLLEKSTGFIIKGLDISESGQFIIPK